MPAYQATTTTSLMLAATNNAYETVFIQNLGPNVVYVELAATTATTTGTQIPITSGTLSLRRPPLTGVAIIAASANQVSPADTRYAIQ